jgi:catechol-2,3-dioxygenase
MHPSSPPRIYETVLYAEPLAPTAAFYRDVIGLVPIGEADELLAAFRMTAGAVLLLFDPRASAAAGRTVPAHGAHGAGHVAFGVDAGELAQWRAWLAEREVSIELEWPRDDGSAALYFRDPAGNSVELVEGELWG